MWGAIVGWLDERLHIRKGFKELLVEPLPEGSRGRGGDRDPALLLLLHPVHGGGTFVDLAHSVQTTCVEQDPLRGRGLTGIDVRHDADIPQLTQWCASCHLSKTAPGSSIGEVFLLVQKKRRSVSKQEARFSAARPTRAGSLPRLLASAPLRACKLQRRRTNYQR